MALLEARGLMKQYGKRVVVKGVDLDVNAGEIVGLLGPNGAGKTTSFRMIVGMIAPKGGRVTFNGHDVTHMPMYKRARLGLGYLAQDSSVFRKLTVEQNLFAILELMTTRRGQPYRSTRKQRRERVDELLEQFGLTRLRKSVAMTLSGGERRRLEIARCLVSEPMLIMLDEPFTGIDPKTVGDIQVIVRTLRDQGIGVLITDHHVAETLRITDRSYLIADGTMLTHGTPLEIINNPKAREVYLGENFSTAAITEEFNTKPSSVRSFLESEDVQDHINALAEEECTFAARAILSKGQAAVPPLVQALQRPDPLIQTRAHELLCEITGINFTFVPGADESTRLRQIAIIRETLDRRQAG